ncbi:MAG TPA: HIT family protein, partial [Actinomycetota bacterium]|nr:HIT family protein [Actinomycetota bacterium]
MCTFCDIATGAIDAHTVYDDDSVVAFLDHRPVFVGHVLVIPRTHHETLADLPADALPHFFLVIQKIAARLPEALDAVGTFVAMNNKVSQSVPHLHCHVVPRRPKDGLRGFFWPRTKYRGGDAEMAEV